jgi:hypothetical protein
MHACNYMLVRVVTWLLNYICMRHSAYMSILDTSYTM